MFGLRVPLVGVSHGYKTRRMKRADALIVLTEDMRRHFLADGYDEKRCFVVSNSIVQVAAEYRPMPPVPVIGAIGRLVYEKGFHLLVQALAELSRRGVLCRAVIAGDGVERESLQRFAAEIGAADLISWAGWVKDKRHFYDVVDMIVFPSLNESFGLVVLEAMNYAKPVIASNTVGPSAIIHHGDSGLLFQNGDVLALVEALESVIGSPELHARLAAGGKQRSLDFSPERFAQRLDAVIKEVAAAQA
jgi:glycosyltransferase involved in cell wall biosynthesis